MSDVMGASGVTSIEQTNGHRGASVWPKGLAGAGAAAGTGAVLFLNRRRRRSRREVAQARARHVADAAGGRAKGALQLAQKAGTEVVRRTGSVAGGPEAWAKRAEQVPPKVADGLDVVADRMRDGSWQGWAVVVLALWALIRWNDRRQLRKFVVASRAVNRATFGRNAAAWTPA
jgi:hypothetical protein